MPVNAALPYLSASGLNQKLTRWAAVARLDAISELVIPDEVAPVFRQAGGKGGLLAWRLLFYGLWHQIHVRGVAADQPVLEILNS